MTQRIWERSVTVGDDGIGWTKAGVRADFIFVLFMHGYSVEELAADLIDGFVTDAEVVEDAIRYGRWLERRRARPAKRPATQRRSTP